MSGDFCYLHIVSDTGSSVKNMKARITAVEMCVAEGKSSLSEQSETRAYLNHTPITHAPCMYLLYKLCDIRLSSFELLCSAHIVAATVTCIYMHVHQ